MELRDNHKIFSCIRDGYTAATINNVHSTIQVIYHDINAMDVDFYFNSDIFHNFMYNNELAFHSFIQNNVTYYIHSGQFPNLRTFQFKFAILCNPIAYDYYLMIFLDHLKKLLLMYLCMYRE